MEKETELWRIERLKKEFSSIDFPEYQREPNVWSRTAKQRLIDSIAREFDIASIYLYKDEAALECIDGRQRIGAIMSFLNNNPDDSDNGFQFRVLNEIYEDKEHPFEALDGEDFETICDRASGGDDTARIFKDTILNYRITIVNLSGSREPEEFNLQFTRLNLGTIINSGEKLNAMVGEMRDVCFNDIGEHGFLEKTRIPTRRFAREQVAAQILSQVFSLGEGNGYTRTRHFDLQKFFKKYTELETVHREWIDKIKGKLDLLLQALDDEMQIFRNRAITVTTVILAYEEDISEHEIEGFCDFVREFLCRLQWQVGKAKEFDVDDAYRYLMEFQRHVTQASVEKYAVEGRANIMHAEYERWKEVGEIGGDRQFREDNPGEDPSEKCREA